MQRRLIIKRDDCISTLWQVRLFKRDRMSRDMQLRTASVTTDELAAAITPHPQGRAIMLQTSRPSAAKRCWARGIPDTDGEGVDAHVSLDNEERGVGDAELRQLLRLVDHVAPPLELVRLRVHAGLPPQQRLQLADRCGLHHGNHESGRADCPGHPRHRGNLLPKDPEDTRREYMHINDLAAAGSAAHGAAVNGGRRGRWWSRVQGSFAWCWGELVAGAGFNPIHRSHGLEALL